MQESVFFLSQKPTYTASLVPQAKVTVPPCQLHINSRDVRRHVSTETERGYSLLPFYTNVSFSRDSLPLYVEMCTAAVVNEAD